MPLYTLWQIETPRQVAWAVVHCTAGHMLIAAAVLAGSLVLFGSAGCPQAGLWKVSAATVIFGLGATVVIERVATAWGVWSYSVVMPVLPGLGVGMAPIVQMVAIPLLALESARAISSRT